MNFYYGLLNIKKNWLMNVFLVLIISLSFFLISFLGSLDYENHKSLNQSKELLNKVSFYVLRQVTPYGKMNEAEAITSEEFEDNLAKIDKAMEMASEEIKTSKIAEVGLLMPSAYYIEEIVDDKKFYSEMVSHVLENEDAASSYDIYLYGFNSSILIDKTVAKYMSYDIKEGRNFEKEDFLRKDKNIFSVIVGADYTNYFQLGDQITAYKNDVEYTFDIVGVLEKDTAVLSLVEVLKPLNGNNSLIVAYDYERDEIGVTQPIQTQGSILITDKAAEVEKLIQGKIESAVNTVDEFSLSSVSGITDDIQWSHNEVTRSYRVLTVVLGVFTLLAIFLSIFMRIKKDVYRMGVFILCGARKMDITKQLIYEKGLLIVFSMILTAVASTILGFNYLSILLIIPMGSALIVFVYATIGVCLRKITVIEAVRRLE